MTKQVQRRRGTATQHTSFTGAEGEISVNTTNKSIHVHDGVTAGGIEGARADMTNVSDGDLNSRLAGNTLSSLTITSADINGGTIDGTVIGGSTPAAGSFTTGSFTGDVSFGDNDKAIFGAGSDLQIYHSGSNSHITEGGTGNLIIRADDFRVQSNAGEEYLAADANGAVSLRYDNAQKLATTSTGVDITGEIEANTAHFGTGTGTGTNVADEVVVSGTASTGLTIHSPDASNATLAFGSVTDNHYAFVQGYYNAGSPFLRLSIENSEIAKVTSTGIDVTGTVVADTANISGSVTVGNDLTITDNLQFVDSGSATRTIMDLSGSDDIRISTGTSSGARSIYMITEGQNALRVHAGGDISFYEDTGTTPKFFWDASTERLGIGNAAPTTALDVTGTVTADGLTVARAGGSVGSSNVAYIDVTSSYGGLSINASTGNNAFIELMENGVKTAGFNSDATNNITSIQSANSHALSLNTGAATTRMMIAHNGDISFYEDTGTTPKFFWDASAESLGIGTSPTQALDVRGQAVVGSGTDGVKLTYSTGNSTGIIDTGFTSTGLEFRTGNSFAAIIDSSGNLLVGTTVTPNTLVGASATQGVAVNGSAGYLVAAANGTATAYFNRQTSDGDIADFRKDGSTVGSIGATSSNTYIGTGATGLRFYDAGSAYYPMRPDTVATRDAAIDLGVSFARFKDLYLSGGVYLGGTGSANKLDDYETGTWTPVVRGGTTAGTFSGGTIDGRYIKIGEMITLMCYIDSASLSGAAGVVEIAGNPFTSAGSSLPANAVAAGRHNSITLSANAVTLNAVNVNGNTLITLRQSYDNGTNASILDVSQLGSNFGVIFNLTFRAA